MPAVFFEILNTDCYRYFQVDDLRAQIFNLLLRSFAPFVAFLGFVWFAKAWATPTEFIVVLGIFSGLACLYSLNRLGWPFARGLARRFNPDFSRLRLSVSIAVPILTAQVAYMQMDKYVAAGVMTKIEYSNYSFFSSIGQAVLLYAQITYIQPRLKDWYGATAVRFDFRGFLMKLLEMAALGVAGTGVLFATRSLQPPTIRIQPGSVLVIAGHISLAASTMIGAYLYATRRDKAVLRADWLVALFAAVFLGLAAGRFLPGRALFVYPPLLFSLALAVKIFVVRATDRSRAAC